MHELLMKFAGMHLKSDFRPSVCIEVYGKTIGTVTPVDVYYNLKANPLIPTALLRIVFLLHKWISDIGLK